MVSGTRSPPRNDDDELARPAFAGYMGREDAYPVDVLCEPFLAHDAKHSLPPERL
jgi:hypothetical protein